MKTVETAFGTFAIDEADRSVSRVLAEKGEYGRRELDAMRLFLDAAEHALVLGAHIGAITVPIAHRVARVTAIEASPRNFRLLEENIRLNGLSNVRAMNVAIADRAGEVDFIDDHGFTGGSKVFPRREVERYVKSDHTVLRLPCDTVDNLFPNELFDFALLDLEGSEIFALRGMTRALDGIRTLVTEFIPHHLRNVAEIDASTLLEPLSAFQTLVSPRLNRVIHREGMADFLGEMFRRGISDETLIFHKDRLKPARRKSG